MNYICQFHFFEMKQIPSSQISMTLADQIILTNKFTNDWVFFFLNQESERHQVRGYKTP